MKKIEVSSCHNCPFLNNDFEEGSTCNFPDNDLSRWDIPRYDSGMVSEKCPMKGNGLIVVALKEEKSKNQIT